jgi:hypothetical protein
MWLPTRARWLLDFETELTSFPTKGVHDDQVDSVSQFLIWLKSFPLTHVPAVASAGRRVGHQVSGGTDTEAERQGTAAEARTPRTARASAKVHRRGPRGTEGFD